MMSSLWCCVGDYDHLVKSRKHFSTSLTMLAPQVNLRALYGLIAACKAIISDDSAEATTKKTFVL